MYNPEKQARAPGGKFGGKVAEVVETVGEKAIEAATMVERAAEPVVEQALEYADDYLPFDGPTRTKANVVGWALLAIAVVIVVALLTGCVSLRH